MLKPCRVGLLEYFNVLCGIDTEVYPLISHTRTNPHGTIVFVQVIKTTPLVFEDVNQDDMSDAANLYLAAASQLETVPGECIVLEDSAAGVEGAVQAGCKVLGFMGGSHLDGGWVDSFMLMNSGAMAVASDMTEVSSLVLSQTKHLHWE